MRYKSVGIDGKKLKNPDIHDMAQEWMLNQTEYDGLVDIENGCNGCLKDNLYIVEESYCPSEDCVGGYKHIDKDGDWFMSLNKPKGAK